MSTVLVQVLRLVRSRLYKLLAAAAAAAEQAAAGVVVEADFV